MKLPLLANLNAIGLRGAADKALLAAHWLKTATVSSPAVTIVPEVPAIAAKPAIIAQTAKPARAATAIVPAAQNTTGYGFGELYLNSPAYPAGTQIPAILAKPASEAVVGVDAVVAVPKVPAVVSPKIDAVKGWDDAIQINKTASNIGIIAYLPYASSPQLLGSDTSSIGAINEMTMPSLTPGKWLGDKSSNTVGTETALPATVERYFYKQAQELVYESSDTATIENSSKLVNGVITPCKKITLNLVADNYDLTKEEIQLDKINKLRLLDPAIYLPIAQLVNNSIKSTILSNSQGNSAAIARVSTLQANLLYEQAVLGGIWFIEPAWNPIGYNDASILADTGHTQSAPRDWFESLGLKPTGYQNQDGIPYFLLEAI